MCSVVMSFGLILEDLLTNATCVFVQVVVVRPTAELCLNVCFGLAFRVFLARWLCILSSGNKKVFRFEWLQLTKSGHFGGSVRACPV